MNVQNIFEALERDVDNSGVGIVCRELEEQGYIVKMNGKPVNSVDIFDGKNEDLEKQLDPIIVELFKDGKREQQFSIEFIGYHEMSIKR